MVIDETENTLFVVLESSSRAGDVAVALEVKSRAAGSDREEICRKACVYPA